MSVRLRHDHVLEHDVGVLHDAQRLFVLDAAGGVAGVDVGTMKPLTWPSSASFAHTIVTSLMEPLPIQRLAPLITQLSPSRFAAVRRPCAESEPESGSVSAKAPSSSPLAKRRWRDSWIVSRTVTPVVNQRDITIHRSST